MSDNTHNKSCQLKLNYMNRHVGCPRNFMQILIYNLVYIILFNYFMIALNINIIRGTLNAHFLTLFYILCIYYLTCKL